MKRRLFLQSSTIGIGGLIALPTMYYGCGILPPTALGGPCEGVKLFQEGSRFFDSAIAELRISGSGRIASAEAEDVTLAGIAEQIAEKQAAVPAELAENFAESSLSLIQASSELVASSSEMFPLNEGMQAELADDYALLKVVKASTLLSSAAMNTPLPQRKVTASEKMIQSASEMHSAISTGAEAEVIEGAGSLQAHAEEYVGSAETFSATPVFIKGAETFVASTNAVIRNPLSGAHGTLLTSTDNISLSASYFGSGTELLNAETSFFNGAEITSAQDLVPAAEMLIPATNSLYSTAQGESAEMGAEMMVQGSNQMLSDAETNPINLGAGAEKLDTGADQYIAGTITFVSAESYQQNASNILRAAENLSGYSAIQSEQQIVESAESLVPASSDFLAGANALQSIKLTGGVQSLVPAASELLSGAEILQSEARTAEAEIGVSEMIQGAEQVLAGASESIANNGQFLSEGAQSVEIGSFSVMSGAAEFIEGYN